MSGSTGYSGFDQNVVLICFCLADSLGLTRVIIVDTGHVQFVISVQYQGTKEMGVT